VDQDAAEDGCHRELEREKAREHAVTARHRWVLSLGGSVLDSPPGGM
jgi:hypothetical protein